MIQRRRCTGFLEETALALGICDSIARQNLNGDCAVQPRVAVAENLAHPAFTESPKDFVGSQPSPRREEHKSDFLGFYLMGRSRCHDPKVGNTERLWSVNANRKYLLRRPAEVTALKL
jgi:hypothetical protein